jgi:hypothetical protein
MLRLRVVLGRVASKAAPAMFAVAPLALDARGTLARIGEVAHYLPDDFDLAQHLVVVDLVSLSPGP